MTEEFVTLETAKLLKKKVLLEGDISYSLIKIFGLAKHLDIDLLWHIEHKQRYNELRPMLNGKRY